jgi:predicted dehydrogenase
MEINRGHAEKLRLKYGAKRAYDNTADLLTDQEVDAVYIASPVVMHAEQTRMAADAGKHILLEKPIAMTCDEGDELLKYCAERGVKVAAGFMMRFGTHIQNMKKFIADGKIGTVVSGYSQFTLWCSPEPGNWRQVKAKSGGGCLMDMGVHCVDLMEYVTGMQVSKVVAMNETVVFDYDVEDTSSLLLRLSNGAQCVVQTNFNIPDEASKWRLEIFGTKGRLLGDTIIGQNDGGQLNAVFVEKNLAYDAAQDHADDAGINISGDFGNMYTREIESFSESILNDLPLEVPASDALRVQRILAAAYQSGENNKVIEL